MTEFKHKIGDELYDYDVFDGNDRTIAYPIIKRTAGYVYVHPGVGKWAQERLARFAVADLERDGRAWNRPHQMGLYTRPGTHWPLMDAIVRKPEQLAITP